MQLSAENLRKVLAERLFGPLLCRRQLLICEAALIGRIGNVLHG